MDQISNKTLDSCIESQDKDILIKLKTGEVVDIIDISVDDGKIISVFPKEGTGDQGYIPSSEFNFFKEVLYVPGIGYITPGTRVIIKEKDYLLKFGWHINISNQNIYSWYLESLSEDIPPKTLYKEMINEIEIVHFV